MSPKYKSHFNFSFIAVMVALALSACDQSKQPSSSNAVTLASLQQRADAGDAVAQYELGMSQRKGDKPDEYAAFKWLLIAAEAGNADAMFEVSTSYRDGIGASRDLESATKWLKRSAALEHAEALGRLALSYGYYRGGKIHVVGDLPEERESNAKVMLDLLQRGAAKGDSRASAQLGACYLFGVNEGKTAVLAQDHAKAINLLKLSADKNSTLGQWMLAVIFQYGFGDTVADPNQADLWWNKVDKISDSHKQRTIGVLYLVEDKKAYVSGKNKWRDRRLSFDESNAIAVEWFEKAANQNDPLALLQLARIYGSGDAVKKDLSKTFGYSLRAAELDDPWAQRQVMASYYVGAGVAKNYVAAIEWAERAVNNPRASRGQIAFMQGLLGDVYYRGSGVQEDLTVAYAWLNLAVSGGLEEDSYQQDAEKQLRDLEGKLSREQLAEAQRLSANWKQGQPMQAAPTQMSAPAENTPAKHYEPISNLKKVNSGSAIIISSRGKLITNQHVVNECTEIRIPVANKNASLVLADNANDLALLQLEGEAVLPGTVPAVFADEASVRQGEDIVTFGFPLDGYLPSSGNITQGIVSALAGPFNNSSVLQITAPIQKGNSGGPVLNMKGQVVGVVIGKADAVKLMKATGDIPQNINFAISGRVAKGFFEGNSISYEKPGTFSFSKDTAALADVAKKITVKVECWR